MPEQSWLESQKKRKKGYWYVVAAVMVVGIGIFIRNNRELFSAKPAASIVAEQEPRQESKKTLVPVPHTEPVAIEKIKEDMPPPVSALMRYSAILPDVQCFLKGRSEFKVGVSLELFVADEAQKKDILAKRENLKVMVQKVFSMKTIDELIVDSLRPQTKTACNALLGKNTIIDVEFREFRIDKVKK